MGAEGDHLRNHWYCQCVKPERVSGTQCAYIYREATRRVLVILESAKPARSSSFHFNWYLFIYLFILSLALGWTDCFWTFSGWQHSAHSCQRRGSGLLQWLGRNLSAAPRAPRSGWTSVPRWMPAVRRCFESRAAAAASPARWREATRAGSTLRPAARGCAACPNLEKPGPCMRSPEDRRCALRPPSLIGTKATTRQVPAFNRTAPYLSILIVRCIMLSRWFNRWRDFISVNKSLGYFRCLDIHLLTKSFVGCKFI